MEVNVKKAVKMFFSKSSFEMIYFEAIANALDANATQIDIVIHGTRDKNKQLEMQNLVLEIRDNGVGIDKIRYDKFSKLFNVEEQSHKGLGRLVYLCYFNKVKVESVFGNVNKREFIFSEEFDKKSGNKTKTCPSQPNGTVFTMMDFSMEKLHKNEYVSPIHLKNSILEYFYPRLYKEKIQKNNIIINITSIIEGVTRTEKIATEDIPNFFVKPINYSIGLFDSLDLYYSIKDNFE